MRSPSRPLHPASASERGRAWGRLYWGLFAAESAGMLLILVLGVPVYRKMLDGRGEDHPAQSLLLPTLAVVCVMQTCYWIKSRLRPSAARSERPVLAHVLAFLARLSFIFAGSLFSLALFRRIATFRDHLPGVTVLLAATFAQFCYSRELEYLARRVERGAVIESSPEGKSGD